MARARTLMIGLMTLWASICLGEDEYAESGIYQADIQIIGEVEVEPGMLQGGPDDFYLNGELPHAEQGIVQGYGDDFCFYRPPLIPAAVLNNMGIHEGTPAWTVLTMDTAAAFGQILNTECGVTPPAPTPISEHLGCTVVQASGRIVETFASLQLPQIVGSIENQ